MTIITDRSGTFYDYFAECEIGVTGASAIDRSLLPSFLPSFLVCISADQCTTSLDEEKNVVVSSNGSANVTHSEAISDEIITAMSTACGASIFLFELFQKNLKHLLS